MKKITQNNHQIITSSNHLIIFFCFSALLLFCSSTLMAQPFPNGDFETGWVNPPPSGYYGPYDEFDTKFFYTLNSLYATWNSAGPIDRTAYKETLNPHGGKICMKLVSGKAPTGEDIFLPGFVGTIDKEFVDQFLHNDEKVTTTRDWGGLPAPHALEVWYRYLPVGGDSALIQIGFTNFVGDPLIVNEKRIIKKETSTWTKLPIPIPEQYRDQPFDEIQLIFSASAGVNFDKMKQCKGVYGSTLWIDDVYLNYDLGIKQNLFSTLKANAFPNPATEVLNFELNEEFTGVIWVYDLSGRKIMESNISGTQSQLNISSLSSGNYIYKLMNENTIFAQGKFVVAK